MNAAAAAQEFEQAAVERNRLAAVRSLLERQRVANAAVGTLDAIAVALAGPGRQRPGLPGPRRRPLGPPVVLPRQRGASARAARCSRSSCCSTTRRRRRCRRWSSSRSRSARPSSRRSARAAAGRVEVRAAERGEKRRILQLAARNAVARARGGAAQGRAPARAPRRGARRAARGARAAGGADADRVLRHLEPAGHPHRRLDGRLRGRRAEALRLPALPHPHASTGPTTSPRWRRCSGRRMANWERQSDTSPHDPGYDASFAALPNLIVIDGGKGQLSAALEPLAAGARRRGSR